MRALLNLLGARAGRFLVNGRKTPAAGVPASASAQAPRYAPVEFVSLLTTDNLAPRRGTYLEPARCLKGGANRRRLQHFDFLRELVGAQGLEPWTR